MAVPGPPEDPYSSLEPVQHLDALLGDLRQVLREVGQALGLIGERRVIQGVATQIVPAAASVAFSIRVMIREGYLVSALILIRPLIERVATLCYLIENEQAIVLWREGWPHRTRPSLKARLDAVVPGAPRVLLDRLSEAVSSYNAMVHGDPEAAQQSLTYAPDGVEYVTDRDYRAPGRAAGIAVETGVAVAILIARTKDIFSVLCTGGQFRV